MAFGRLRDTSQSQSGHLPLSRLQRRHKVLVTAHIEGRAALKQLGFLTDPISVTSGGQHDVTLRILSEQADMCLLSLNSSKVIRI